MSLSESKRAGAIQSPIIPVVAEMIRQSPGTISLGQGVVYYPPPNEARERIQEFWADQENHKYKPVQGLESLRQVLRQKLAAENGIVVTDQNPVVVTAGGNLAFTTVLLSIADAGDEIILPTPYYFNHEMAITMIGATPVLVPTDQNYQLDVAALAKSITPRTKAIVTVSPNNPTGAVYPESDLRAVNELCRERGIYHISDEAYEYFTYGEARHFSAGSLPDTAGHTISLYSLSKAFGFASWRIGYMAVPAQLLSAINKIQDTILICPPVISQYAAMGALQAGRAYCREKLAIIEQTRVLFLRELSALSNLCDVPPTAGAFYFLLRLHSDLPPLEVVRKLVADHKVAVIPGNAFGIAQGSYLRVAYGALKTETASEGLGRLICGLKQILS